MQVKYRGALTFDTDESLTTALKDVENRVKQDATSLLTMDHIEPLGLHATVHYSGEATPEQLQFSRQILESLAAAAYSGYVDLWVDNANEAERYHAKEIAPKELTVEDIAST